MADLVIPAWHRLALALREPNLLVPGVKPVSGVKAKPGNGLVYGYLPANAR